MSLYVAVGKQTLTLFLFYPIFEAQHSYGKTYLMNLDEASKKKVLTILVSFYDEESGQGTIEHLDSVEIRKTDADTIF